MSDLLLHVCCGPCASVAVPAWRERGVEPLALFHNPNIQPAAEVARREEAWARFRRAAGVVEAAPHTAASAAADAAWQEWRRLLAEGPAEERCRRCLRLRLGAAASAAAALGLPRFSTTLSVSPYQRHDLLLAAGEAAAAEHGVRFVYLDLRPWFRRSYGESRRLGLYRQPYCGCVASKWEAWHERRERRRTRPGVGR